MIKDLSLKDKKCIPCEGGVPPLDGSEIANYLEHVRPEWQVLNNKKIRRQFAFVNFKQTMDFVNKVANIADEEGHHPVMVVNYGQLDIELWTHAIHGLSENDFILAAKIDEI